MASRGLRAISYQGTRKVEAGYNPSHTSETLIGHIVCYQLAVISVFKNPFNFFNVLISLAENCLAMGTINFPNFFLTI